MQLTYKIFNSNAFGYYFKRLSLKKRKVRVATSIGTENWFKAVMLRDNLFQPSSLGASKVTIH